MKKTSTLIPVKIFRTGLFIAAFAFGTANATTLSANFDAAGTDADQFLGGSGDGWAGGWTQLTNPRADVTASQTFSTSDPISGAGSLFLTSTNTRINNAGTTRANVRRQMDSPILANPFTIEFDFRIDQKGLGDFDQAQFILRSSSDGAGAVSAAGNSVGIEFRNNDIRMRSGGSWVTENTSLAVDTVYSASIAVNPGTAKWVFSLTGGAVNYTSGTLDFQTTPGVNWMHFGTQTGGTATEGPHLSTMSWTVDNVSVIPEPGTLALVGIALGSLLLFRRRRG